MVNDPRLALAAIVAATPDETLASLSRVIGRNAAYLQQFVMRGTPRVLAERDRRTLARYLGVAESALGGPAAGDTIVRVPRVRVAAAAGAGALVGEEEAIGAIGFDRRLLDALGVGPGASLIEAVGDSMEPTIRDGDTMLVDTGRRKVARVAAVFVLRIDAGLVVKRARRDGDRLIVTSDNPAAPSIAPMPVDEAGVIGRVMWIGRVL